MGKEGELHELIRRLVFSAMVHGGPEYRELMEALHVLKHAWHAAKELGEGLVDEDQ